VIVSIARELGAGGLSVGEAIAGALGAPLLDFDSDVYDSRQYDLVLNTESLGVDLAISVANSVAAAFAACEAGTRIA
jgi:hypothetical protein